MTELTPVIALENDCNDTTDDTTLNMNSSDAAWKELEQALLALHITTKACPTLRLAVDDLVSCLPLFETVAKSRQDYEDLATGLKVMAGLLTQHLEDATYEVMTNALTGIAEAIRREIELVRKHQAREGLRRILGPTGDGEDLIRRYRRIEQLFRQLQGEASLGAWSTGSKHYVNTQLETLRTAKLARYNSELAMEVSRRACTENTRTEILDNLVKWSEDCNAASIYWMNGMAGTGKTTIAYSTCAALESSKQLAASFFCTRMSPECRDAKRIIPTIAYQLAQRSTPFQSALCKVLEEDKGFGTGTISAQFDQLLRVPLVKARNNMPNNLVVVIDALDECDDSYVVELFLGLLFRSIVDLPIKFFITSRPEPIIQHRMMSESERSRSILYLQEIEPLIVQADIELYLKKELAHVSPLDQEIKTLAEHAGQLFIYAATAVRYICLLTGNRAVDPRERLETILAANTTSNKSLLSIDALYSVILMAAIEGETLERKEQDMKLVVWAIVCAREPVLISTIAAITGLGNLDKVVATLEPLKSVLHVSDPRGLVTILHASFPDFILSHERSKQFACHLPGHSYILSLTCFEIMKTQLRFNICNIESSFIPDHELPNLGEQIDANISEELFYACRFWMDHLELVGTSDARGLTNKSDQILLVVEEFLLQYVPLWIEVLSLKRALFFSIGSAALMKQASSDLYELASKVQTFVIDYASWPISNYTPHIYLSALPFSPLSSYYSSRFKGPFEISGAILSRIHQAALSTWELESTISTAVFSPKGDRIILGGNSGTITVQKTHDGKHLFRPHTAHKGPVASVGVSRDGTKMVTGSHDMTLSVWDTYDGSLVVGPFHGHTGRVTSVAFSPDIMHVASGSDDCTIGIWSLHDATTPTRLLTGHTATVNSISFSSDGIHLISGSSDCTARIWNVFSGATILALPVSERPVTLAEFTSNGSEFVCFSAYDPDGHAHLSYTAHYNISLWNTSNGALLKSSNHEEVSLVAISPRRNQFAGVVGHSINVWDMHYGNRPIAGPFNGHSGNIVAMNFSDDGTRIVSASDDLTVRVWNVHGELNQAETPSNTPWRIIPKMVALAPNQRFIATSEFTNINVFDLDTHTHTTSSSTSQMISPVKYLQISPDATRVFSVHTSGTIYTWDAHTVKLIDGPRRCSTSLSILSAACSIDGTRVATYYSDAIEIWDTSRSVTLCKLTGGSYSLTDTIIFSHTGNRILTITKEGILSKSSGIDVWEVDSGARVTGPIFSAEGKALDLSPDGTYVACCTSVDQTDYDLKLINTTTEETTLVPPVGQPHGAQSISAKFSPDGLHVICLVGSMCFIWDLHHQTAISSLGNLNTEACWLPISYSPDGRCLASDLSATSFRAQRFDINKPVFTLCRDGWLVDDQSRPLFWIPEGIRTELPRNNGFYVEKGSSEGHRTESPGDNGFHIRKGGSLLVDYRSMFVGDDWSKCYIGD
ncbi:putative vegetative incompatibility protein HET-E-1 [Rhizoctonia solani 123E]|uniref:Putative vegetative incompatibility protein HET-E-1 n=1 Tax=Rhizoctonia solani 123E TaxID=1423351 RepID=A0A074RPZ2_9AGAM|nr:putative vegetative incompatibility protein HET-E-1 [Rhizoctonia solani 123E]